MNMGTHVYNHEYIFIYLYMSIIYKYVYLGKLTFFVDRQKNRNRKVKYFKVTQLINGKARSQTQGFGVQNLCSLPLGNTMSQIYNQRTTVFRLDYLAYLAS